RSLGGGTAGDRGTDALEGNAEAAILALPRPLLLAAGCLAALCVTSAAQNTTLAPNVSKETRRKICTDSNVAMIIFTFISVKKKKEEEKGEGEEEEKGEGEEEGGRSKLPQRVQFAKKMDMPKTFCDRGMVAKLSKH
ncbi:hypothetical protein EI555_013931, partial [Monodon monoceros]